MLRLSNLEEHFGWDDMPVRLLKSDSRVFDPPYHNAIFILLEHWMPEQSYDCNMTVGFYVVTTWN